MDAPLELLEGEGRPRVRTRTWVLHCTSVSAPCWLSGLGVTSGYLAHSQGPHGCSEGPVKVEAAAEREAFFLPPIFAPPVEPQGRQLVAEARTGVDVVDRPPLPGQAVGIGWA